MYLAAMEFKQASKQAEEGKMEDGKGLRLSWGVFILG